MPLEVITLPFDRRIAEFRMERLIEATADCHVQRWHHHLLLINGLPHLVLVLQVPRRQGQRSLGSRELDDSVTCEEGTCRESEDSPMQGAEPRPRTTARPARRPRTDAERPEVLTEAERRRVESLRVLRRNASRELAVPAYRVLTDRQLVAIAVADPSDANELAQVVGVGPATVLRHGPAILNSLARERLASARAEDDADASSPMT